MIRSLGVKVDRVVIGRHAKLYLRHGERERMFVTPLTGSDRRGARNFRAEVARWVDAFPRA